MRNWCKRLSDSFVIKIRNEIIQRKYCSYPMATTTLAIILFMSGAAFAYFVTFLPTFLLSFFSSNQQIGLSAHSSHDTSIMLRVRQQQIPPNPDVKREAITAMNLALDMEAQGKRDKATKLYQQALALDPSHADILTAYGEFLEKDKDIVKADHMYKKALHICPDHTKALINRQRILPLVEEIDHIRFNRIDKKLEHFIRVPLSHPGLRRAKKEAYFSHIYHTNAIEGNTLTLSQTRSIVETRIAIGGKSLVEQNEVLGLDSALSYLNNTLMGRIGSLTLNDILEIHKRVLGYVDPTEAGRLRVTQVFVGDFTPPPALDLPVLMNDFVEWLNSEEALKLHPVEYAALAHYKLVVIHPFYDGNGRTSRLLMNLILMQAGYPPVSVKVEDRFRYYETLELGNEGDIRPFIRFIAECTERTLDEFILATSENATALMLKLNGTDENVISNQNG